MWGEKSGCLPVLYRCGDSGVAGGKDPIGLPRHRTPRPAGEEAAGLRGGEWTVRRLAEASEDTAQKPHGTELRHVQALCLICRTNLHLKIKQRQTETAFSSSANNPKLASKEKLKMFFLEQVLALGILLLFPNGPHTGSLCDRLTTVTCQTQQAKS